MSELKEDLLFFFQFRLPVFRSIEKIFEMLSVTIRELLDELKFNSKLFFISFFL